MPTDLALHIEETRLVDTHEHLNKEPDWVEKGPADVLQDLFQNYVPAELRLTLWDGSHTTGRERLLATTGFHGGPLDWITKT